MAVAEPHVDEVSYVPTSWTNKLIRNVSRPGLGIELDEGGLREIMAQPWNSGQG